VRLAPTTVVKGRCHLDGKISIGAKTIVQSSFLDGRGGVTVGAHVILDQCTVLSAQHDIDDPAYPTNYASVEIGDYVIVYQGALILPGRRIGRGAIVAAHSVVTRDVPTMAVVGGNPARVLRQRFAVHDLCDLPAMAGLNLLDKIRQQSR
jgi:acetyltransferase-like isoleucine patch superfamily enzyme